MLNTKRSSLKLSKTRVIFGQCKETQRHEWITLVTTGNSGRSKCMKFLNLLKSTTPSDVSKTDQRMVLTPTTDYLTAITIVSDMGYRTGNKSEWITVKRQKYFLESYISIHKDEMILILNGRI